MAKKRSNYIITNKLLIKSHRSIIDNDLIPWINTKFNTHFATSNEASHIIFSTVPENPYIDGFDICFDKIAMK